MAGGIAGAGHRALLVGWRYSPLWVRWIAIRVLYPRFALGAVAVIRDDGGRLLLIPCGRGRSPVWGAPGDRLRRSETPRQTVLRATYQQAGVRVSIGPVVAVHETPSGALTVAYACRLVEGGSAGSHQQSTRAAYFSPASLPPLSNVAEHLLREALSAPTDGSDILLKARLFGVPGPGSPYD